MKERHNGQHIESSTRQTNIGPARDLARPPTREDSFLPTPVSPLKQMRKDRKLRQSDLAHLADVSQGHLSEVENGIAMPSQKLSRLLEAIDLLEAQKEFIEIRQMQTKRKSHHQLRLLGGGGVHGVRD